LVLEGQVGAEGIPLGPFVLHEVIGRAGMGVVWSGTHVEQGAPVAVKVLTQEGSKDPLFLASLRNEVRGVAGLDHPGVVRVYDQGTVPRSVADPTGGVLSAGSPYLVMEMLEGGTLLPLCGRMGWTQIWQVLAQILSGLAHAHARGVIHRDIKPSNILLRRKGAGVTLVDFGLARAGDRERGGSAFLDLGTPGYMAPEQIRRQFRDIGPWTDLYAVGCVATALVSARPPFVGDSAEAVLLAHLNQPIPALNPLMPVPDGFEAWVERLLSKSHHLRFGRAADAIWALMRLVDEEEENVEVLLEPLESGSSLMGASTTSLQPLGEIRDGPLLVASDTAVMDPDFRSSLGGRVAPAPMPELPPPLILCDRPARPPVPSDWRNAGPERRPLRLLGTGLGIFGLRDLPVIGREAEQDLLWAQLERTI
jgi:serine/threonine protein kinase